MFKCPASWHNDQTIHRPARSQNPFAPRRIPVPQIAPQVAPQRDVLYLGTGYIPQLSKLLPAVCSHFGVDMADAISNRRNRRAVRTRQIYYFLAKKHTPKSLQQIGRLVGHNDHTTVLHGCRKIAGLLEDYAADIKAIETELGLYK